MLKLVQALPGLRDQRIEPTRAFISRTMRSVCIDEWRRRAQRPRTEDASELALDDRRTESPPDAATARESRESVRAAWRDLPERDRAILELRFDDGLGFREIAEVLGVPQGSVAGWYSRALASLREKLR
jgi:RNA polymerase sigma-70 factor (ECF subfamily)